MAKLTPDEVILGLLKYEPSHGYQLLEKFKSIEQLRRIWNMSTSQLYSVLNRLAEMGAISGEQIETGIAPTRIVFSITKLGEEKIYHWLYTPTPLPSIHQIRVMFISRIYIANLLNLKIEPIVGAQLASCAQQIQVLHNRLHKTNSEIEKLTIGYVINQLKAAGHWIKDTNFHISV